MEIPPSAGPTTGPPPPPPPPPPYGSPRPRQLRRRPDEGPIGGVCAGVAEYFNVDPVIVRIATVVLAVTGPGVIAYLLAWIFVPAEHGPAVPYTAGPPDRRDRGAQIFGIVLLAIAVSVLWGDWWSPARRWIFPLGLIALGTWLLLRRDGRDDGALPAEPHTPPPGTPGTSAWQPPGTPTATVPVGTEPVRDPPAAGERTAPEGADEDAADRAGGDPADADATLVDGEPVDRTTEPAEASGAGSHGWGWHGGGTFRGGSWHGSWHGGAPPEAPGAPGAAGAPYGMPPNGAAHRRRGMLGGIVVGALLVWAGIAWLTGASVEVGLAVGLCIVGVGFVLGAFFGGAWGLIVPALLIGAALAFATAVDLPLSGPIGHRTWAPTEVEDVDDDYRLSIGEGILDLTDVPLDDGDRLAIDASVGVGHLVIEVPEDVTVEVSADVSGGEALLFGIADNGMGVSVDRTFEGDPDAGTIDLDLQVGFGQIELVRGPR